MVGAHRDATPVRLQLPVPPCAASCGQDKVESLQVVRRLRNSDGFTLLEMLVVAAIVAVLAGAAMVGYRQSKITRRGSLYGFVAALAQPGQFIYMQSCGKQRYAPTLVALGTPRQATSTGS